MQKSKIIKSIEYVFPVVIFFILLIILYPVVNSLNESEILSDEKNIISNKVSDLKRNLSKNDNRRINDLEFFSQVMEKYLRDNGQYPVAIETEKISVEESNIFQTLKNDGYFFEVYKDPSSDKYYGYRSDGNSYELSAVLENSEDSRCVLEGNYCIYRLKKEIPKCEFPDKILSLIRKNDNKTENSFQGKRGGLGLLQRVTSYYRDTKEPDNTSYVTVYISEFENQVMAEKYLQAIEKSQECNMANTNGRCVKWYTGEAYRYKVKGMDFVWREFKTIKQFHVLEQGQITSLSSLESRAEGKASFFTSQFRNCKL